MDLIFVLIIVVLCASTLWLGWAIARLRGGE